MSRRLNVLVLGVGGNVSQGIQKALRLASTPTRTVAGCIDATSPGLYVADRAVISPLAADPRFMPWLLDICRGEAIDAVLSGNEDVLAAIAPRVQEIRDETGAVCVVSSPDVLAIGQDKLLTCRWLEQHGLPVPGYADASDAAAVAALVARHGFPLIAKPRSGKGAQGIFSIEDAEALERDIGNDVLLQEQLGDPSEEFTAGCFCDRDGRLSATIVLRRTLHAGTTYTAELGDHPRVREAAERIVQALRPLGPCNVQLRLRDGEPVPFELNVRFSGTTPLRARMGVNEVDAALRHFVLDEPVPPMTPADSGVALRYWNEIYVPRQALEQLRASGQLDDPADHGAHVEDWGFRP